MPERGTQREAPQAQSLFIEVEDASREALPLGARETHPHLDAASHEVYGEPLDAHGPRDLGWCETGATDELSSSDTGGGYAMSAPPGGGDDEPVEAGATLHTWGDDWKRGADGYTAGEAKATADASATLHDNGGAAEVRAKAGADADNGEGLIAHGTVSFGGGVEAYAQSRRVDDERILVTVVLKANGSLGGETGFAQDDQGGDKVPFSGGIGLSGAAGGEWVTSEVLDGDTARVMQAAWDAGDAVAAVRCMASLAAIVERIASGRGTDVSARGLTPGEHRRSSTSVEGELCLSAAWAPFSVEGAAGSMGAVERAVTARPDGGLDVVVAFRGRTTLRAEGEVDLGPVTLTAGRASEVTAGLEVRFDFSGSERDRADDVLGVSRRIDLERHAEAHDRVVVTSFDGLTDESSHGVGAFGGHAGWESGSERHDAVAVDTIDGTMVGSSVEGEGTHGFAVRGGEQDLLGATDRTAIEAEVDEAGMRATFEDEQSRTGLGLPTVERIRESGWPRTFEDAFVRSRSTLTEVSLSDAEIRDILNVRVYDEASWEQCARTIATHHKWIACGAAIRSASPEPEWVEADADMAVLVARMRPLADFVASTTGSAHVIHNLTQRFGRLTEVDLGYQRIGTLESWPAGTEEIKEQYDALVPELESLEAELDVLAGEGAFAEGLGRVDRLSEALDGITAAIGRVATEDSDRAARKVEEIAKVRVDLAWQGELFARRAECDPAGTEGNNPFVYDGDAREQEARVWLSAMEGYQQTERAALDRWEGESRRWFPGGMFANYRDFLREMSAVYDLWHNAWWKFKACKQVKEAPAFVPRPSADRLEQVSVALYSDSAGHGFRRNFKKALEMA